MSKSTMTKLGETRKYMAKELAKVGGNFEDLNRAKIRASLQKLKKTQLTERQSSTYYHIVKNELMSA